MAIQVENSLLHWNYFMALESDVAQLSRYVEFAESNWRTYSIEAARLLLAASSEVDVLAKQLCRMVDPEAKVENINRYHPIITGAFPTLREAKVTLPRCGLTLTPWIHWRATSPPRWWTAHNKVKHERNDHFKEGNLQNALNAMAGLFLLVLHFYRRTGEETLKPAPAWFQPPEDLASIGVFLDAGYCLSLRH